MDESHILALDLQKRFLTNPRAVSGCDGFEGAWEEAAELGLLLALAPDELGGLGTNGDFRFSYFQQRGELLGSMEFGPSQACVWSIFAAVGREDLTDALGAGTCRVAVPTFGEGPGSFPQAQRLAASPASDGFLAASGRFDVMRGAPVATHFLLPAWIEPACDPALILLPSDHPGLRIAPFKLVDGARAGTLELESAPIGPEAILARGEAAEALWIAGSDAMATATAAEAVGVMQAMLDQSVAFISQRKQFGQTIGSFQAIQHRAAEMLVEVALARALTLAACRNPADAMLVSGAKARANIALQGVADSAVQFHGGIGTTEELPLSKYFRRAMTLRAESGSREEHHSRVEAIVEGQLARDGARESAMAGAGDPSLDAFRTEVCGFLDRALTPRLRELADRQTGTFAEPGLAREWHRILHGQGWIAPHWPVEFGGTGWSAQQRLAFERECALANAPLLPAMGINMCGPVLIGHGTDEQKARFLPRILSGEDLWCQGYSEPGAGSDLASLRTRAVGDGDEYVIDGTKIWTTFAHAADWMFLLARTDPEVKPQAGISFFLVPMDAPGITVTPILSMSGEHEVNQVFLDGVRIPAANRVGAENQGWAVAKYLLEFERGGVAATARTLRVIGLLRRLAKERGGLPPALLHRYCALEVEIAATEAMQQDMMAAIDSGQSVGNTNASILKLKASQLYQAASQLFLDSVGDWGLVDQTGSLFGTGPHVGPASAQTAAARFMNSKALSIFGGSSEIQKTILARSALRL